jgi:hypothetical protein
MSRFIKLMERPMGSLALLIRLPHGAITSLPFMLVGGWCSRPVLFEALSGRFRFARTPKPLQQHI